MTSMNEAEAERCLQKAQQALNDGDAETAKRLSSKALRMFSSDASKAAAETLIHRAEAAAGRAKEGGRAKSSAADSPVPTDGIRQRRSEPQPSPDSNYNREIEAKCQAILRARDYYKILGVEKSSSSEEVKKAYRKLALQLHPDKAKCPSAEAAFKELAKAYQCLSEADARAHYDLHGFEEGSPQQQQYRQHYESHFMTPEELFESFFGIRVVRAPQTQRRVYRTHFGQATDRGAPDQRRTFGFLQSVLPLLILILFTTFSSLFNSVNAPPYSFSRTSDYSVSRSTALHGVPYFVKPNFQRSYADLSEKLRDLEVNVELSHFSTECTREQQTLHQQLQTLRYYGTAHQYRKKAEELRQREENSASCRTFKKLKAAFPRHAAQLYRQSSSPWF